MKSVPKQQIQVRRGGPGHPEFVVASLDQGRGLTHEINNDTIALFGAAILQTAREILDELNA
jgi:hypothetical protein